MSGSNQCRRIAREAWTVRLPRSIRKWTSGIGRPIRHVDEGLDNRRPPHSDLDGCMDQEIKGASDKSRATVGPVHAFLIRACG
jgi:hypothetical protein